MIYKKLGIKIVVLICAAVFVCSLSTHASATTYPLATGALESYLKTKPQGRARIDDQAFANWELSKPDAAAAAKILWADHVARLRIERADEMKNLVIKDGDKEMPFFYKLYGDKPKTGRRLFISMHGGGNGPKAMNDQQWQNQKLLYKPDEGVYVAPRAPTNTWNLWHEPHIDRMFARLIEDMIVFEDVNPDQVYIMGYSAGGDGVYQLAPRMADYLAAASMMAGHPNDASPLGLRNLPFAIHVGELDNGYNRNKVAREWGQKLDDLHNADKEGYEHIVELHKGKAHWMDREDASAVGWMASHTRNLFPTKIVWRQSSVIHNRFYWLAVTGKPKPGDLIEATIEKNIIELKSQAFNPDCNILVRLNDQMANLDQPITVLINGKKVFEGSITRTIKTMKKTLDERGDNTGVFTAEIEIKAADLLVK